jgi:GNAT superfamily N-acetyltransferase
VNTDAYDVRLAEIADVPSLASIERRAVVLFEGWPAQTGLTPDVLKDVSSFEELDEARRRGQLWVATCGSEIVGFAQAMILDGAAHLDEIDVVPEHMRQGVGSRLIETVCRWAREAGCAKITLCTFRDIPWNRPFYESRGFHVVDPQRLSPQLRALVAAEHARGFRADRRVVMERPLHDPPEAWLRGPLPGFAPVLMPAAHALVQAREDVQRAADATTDELWHRPGGAASAGYHLQHLAGSLDRLLTYARGESLNEHQRATLSQEGTPGAQAAALVAEACRAIDRALEQIRHTVPETLFDKRAVGRARLPATVLGLIFHAAEHTTRHAGQLITTLKVVRGS